MSDMGQIKKKMALIQFNLMAAFLDFCPRFVYCQIIFGLKMRKPAIVITEAFSSLFDPF